MVISGGNFKPDTLKPKEVVSLLLDDDELEKKRKLAFLSGDLGRAGGIGGDKLPLPAVRQRQEEKRQQEESSKVKERKRKREKYAEKVQLLVDVLFSVSEGDDYPGMGGVVIRCHPLGIRSLPGFTTIWLVIVGLSRRARVGRPDQLDADVPAHVK